MKHNQLDYSGTGLLNGVRLLLLSLLIIGILAAPVPAAEPLKALIIDGQNNHSMWPKTTFMMRGYLQETGLFEVEIARTRFTWKGEGLLDKFPLEGVETVDLPEPMADPDFSPDFSAYDVVVSNFGNSAAPWPEKTRRDFVEFVRGGGGLVVVHAADNCFGDWPEYNEMIGVGGWGGRKPDAGPYVYLDKREEVVRDTSRGPTGHHGPQREFVVNTRDDQHPITRGMPGAWMHAKDELYDSLRGPAQNMTILASAYAGLEQGGTGRHEPIMMAITFGHGRVFHTTLGHADYSMECVGFIASLQRGAEWAATGEVTQPLPDDFPTSDAASSRLFRSE